MERRSLFLAALFVLLCVATVTYAYYRSYIISDYVVEYEAACDPVTEACHSFCEEGGECNLYKVLQKNARDLQEQCGDSIEACELASTCQQTDAYCVSVSCSPDEALGITCTEPSLSNEAG